MFTIHATIQGISMGLHSASDFGFIQSLAYGLIMAGAEVEWVDLDEFHSRPW